MTNDRALVTLTTEESKRLIAKGIAALPVVQSAKESGMIGFCVCSSAKYVAEELLGKPLPAFAHYFCGFISPQGLYALPDEEASKQLVLVNGNAVWLDWPKENLMKVIRSMGAHDVIIKSGNILDPERKAGTLVGMPNGGEYGKYLPYILARGINLIVPMTLNKSVNYLLDEIIPEMGITRFSPQRTHGEPCGMLPLPGLVFTESDALETLAGVRSLPVALGGFGDGRGTVTLLLLGQEQNIENAWSLIASIKGEPPMETSAPRALFGEGDRAAG